MTLKPEGKTVRMISGIQKKTHEEIQKPPHQTPQYLFHRNPF